MARIRVSSSGNAVQRMMSILVMGVLLFGFGIFTLCSSLIDQVKYNAGPQDFNLLSEAELKKTPYVNGTIEYVFEIFAEEYTTNNGVRTSSKSDKLYYLIPQVDDAGYVTSFISFEATSKYYKTLDKIYDETWNDITSGEYTTLDLENAKIKKMSSDIRNILYEWCVDGNFYTGGSLVDWCIEGNFFGTSDADEIVGRIYPYMIVPDQVPGRMIPFGLVIAGIGAVLLLIAFLVIKKDKAKAAAAAADTGLPVMPTPAPAAAESAPVFQAAEESAPAEQPAASVEAPKAVFCTQCGTPLEPGRKFCPNCGAQVSEQE